MKGNFFTVLLIYCRFASKGVNLVVGNGNQHLEVVHLHWKRNLLKNQGTSISYYNEVEEHSHNVKIVET